MDKQLHEREMVGFNCSSMFNGGLARPPLKLSMDEWLHPILWDIIPNLDANLDYPCL